MARRLVMLVMLLLVGCTYRVETRKTEAPPLVVDEGAWRPTPAEEALLLGTHRLAPDVHPESSQVYRWLAMLLLAPDGAFLGVERATFFNGDDHSAELGLRNRRGTYALGHRSDGARTLTLTFARANDGEEASRTDLGSVTYLVRLGATLALAYDDAGDEPDDAFFPMKRDALGACTTADDRTAQHAEGRDPSWRCVIPEDVLGPSFGTCVPLASVLTARKFSARPRPGDPSSARKPNGTGAWTRAGRPPPDRPTCACEHPLERGASRSRSPTPWRHRRVSGPLD